VAEQELEEIGQDLEGRLPGRGPTLCVVPKLVDHARQPGQVSDGYGEIKEHRLPQRAVRERSQCRTLQDDQDQPEIVHVSAEHGADDVKGGFSGR
jgi:hypothetical protein